MTVVKYARLFVGYSQPFEVILQPISDRNEQLSRCDFYHFKYGLNRKECYEEINRTFGDKSCSLATVKLLLQMPLMHILENYFLICVLILLKFCSICPKITRQPATYPTFIENYQKSDITRKSELNCSKVRNSGIIQKPEIATKVQNSSKLCNFRNCPKKGKFPKIVSNLPESPILFESPKLHKMILKPVTAHKHEIYYPKTSICPKARNYSKV